MRRVGCLSTARFLVIIRTELSNPQVDSRRLRRSKVDAGTSPRGEERKVFVCRSSEGEPKASGGGQRR